MTSATRVPAGLRPFRRTGRISRVIGLEIEVKGLNGGIGDAVLLGPPGRRIRAEVVAVSGNANILMPLGSASGLSPLPRNRRAVEYRR